MNYFQKHKQTLVFQHSQSCCINDTPLDHQLQAVYDSFDKDDMESNLFDVEREGYYKECWNDFLQVVYTVRDKRTARFNEICMKLREHSAAICYQVKNSDPYFFNQIEGLWVIIRGDIWQSLDPSFFINNSDVTKEDAVFLQFEGIFTEDYKDCWKSSKTALLNDTIVEQVYAFVRKRYLSMDDLASWLNLIQSGSFGKHLTTISVLSCIDNKWTPKKYIYYFDPDKIGELDGIIEFIDGQLYSIPLIATKSTAAIERTLMLTNKDCEKYCSLVEPKDSKPYAINRIHNTRNTYYRIHCEYRCRVYSLEFKYKEYDQYFEEKEIENICVK